MLVARARASDIRRPGGPTGVALVDGSWHRATTTIRAFAIGPAHADGSDAAMAEKRTQRSLLIDSSANSVNSATSVRS
jgi:hypothetical protein